MKTIIFVLIISQFAFSCEHEKSSNIKSINGSWKVIRQNISGELKSVNLPENNPLHPDISVILPDSSRGSINGNTFFNYIWAQFEIRDEKQISFRNYGGSRIMEDDFGMSFRENLLITTEFKLSNDTLYFLDSQNKHIIIFTKK